MVINTWPSCERTLPRTGSGVEDEVEEATTSLDEALVVLVDIESMDEYFGGAS